MRDIIITAPIILIVVATLGASMIGASMKPSSIEVFWFNIGGSMAIGWLW